MKKASPRSSMAKTLMIGMANPRHGKYEMVRFGARANLRKRTGLSGEKTSRPISFYGSNSVGTKVTQECRCVVMTWVSGRSVVIRQK